MKAPVAEIATRGEAVVHLSGKGYVPATWADAIEEQMARRKA